MKTRYAKPFEGVQVKIPYSTGMSPYSGLVDLAEKAGLLVKDGNRLRFGKADSPEEIKQFRKAWELNQDGCLDTVMETLKNQSKEVNSVEVEAMEDVAVEKQLDPIQTVDDHSDVHEVITEENA